MAQLNNITAAQYDILYMANDTFDLVFTVSLSGSPVALTEKAIVFLVKREKNEPDSKALVTLTTAAGGLTVGGDNDNQITCSGEHNLDAGTYYYAFKNTTDNDTLMEGKFIVTVGVVQETT